MGVVNYLSRSLDGAGAQISDQSSVGGTAGFVYCWAIRAGSNISKAAITQGLDGYQLVVRDFLCVTHDGLSFLLLFNLLKGQQTQKFFFVLLFQFLSLF